MPKIWKRDRNGGNGAWRIVQKKWGKKKIM